MRGICRSLFCLATPRQSSGIVYTYKSINYIIYIFVFIYIYIFIFIYSVTPLHRYRGVMAVMAVTALINPRARYTLHHYRGVTDVMAVTALINPRARYTLHHYRGVMAVTVPTIPCSHYTLHHYRGVMAVTKNPGRGAGAGAEAARTANSSLSWARNRPGGACRRGRSSEPRKPRRHSRSCGTATRFCRRA